MFENFQINDFLPHLRCAQCVVGIIIMLGWYGVVQERVMSVPYGEEFFKYSVFLVLCNRMFGVLYALAMAVYNQESLMNGAPLWKYLLVSIANVFATTCGYESLKWVSFPVMVLGKSFKMMPVMIWGILISQKVYSLTDWAVAAVVTAGVVQFLLAGSTAPPSATGNSVYGLALLFGFLFFDGLTSTFQEKVFKEHSTSKYNQMLYLNLGSACISSISLIATGGFTYSFAFCVAHPAFIWDASLLSAAAVGGQFFIFSMVKEFGALALAAAMNVRQIVSIVVSYILYSKPVALLQILGLVMVFGALFYKSAVSYEASREKEAAKQEV